VGSVNNQCATFVPPVQANSAALQAASDRATIRSLFTGEISAESQGFAIMLTIPGAPASPDIEQFLTTVQQTHTLDQSLLAAESTQDKAAISRGVITHNTLMRQLETQAAALGLSACEPAAAQPTQPEFYPPAASRAGNISPARQLFIQRVDQTCARDFNAGVPPSGELAEIVALGQPLDGAAAYEKWLGNMRTRVGIDGEIQAAQASGDVASADAYNAQWTSLKRLGNLYGEQFGLVICTSNGPQPN
jgi:hypothetical protein